MSARLKKKKTGILVMFYELGGHGGCWLATKNNVVNPLIYVRKKKKKTHKEGPLGGTSCTSFLLEKQTNFLLGPWASLIAKPKVELKSNNIFILA